MTQTIVDPITGEVRKNENGARFITASAGVAGCETFIARFDAAADMPADITSAANVAADLVTIQPSSTTARKIQILWHGGVSTYNATAGAGPIATGAIVTVNGAGSASTRLTYTDLTGGGTSTAGKTDTIIVSADNPYAEITVSDEIDEIVAIGIPVGVTPTSIVPSFLEVRVIG